MLIITTQDNNTHTSHMYIIQTKANKHKQTNKHSIILNNAYHIQDNKNKTSTNRTPKQPATNTQTQHKDTHQ